MDEPLLRRIYSGDSIPDTLLSKIWNSAKVVWQNNPKLNPVRWQGVCFRRTFPVFSVFFSVFYVSYDLEPPKGNVSHGIYTVNEQQASTTNTCKAKSPHPPGANCSNFIPKVSIGAHLLNGIAPKRLCEAVFGPPSGFR